MTVGRWDGGLGGWTLADIHINISQTINSTPVIMGVAGGPQLFAGEQSCKTVWGGGIL